MHLELLELVLWPRRGGHAPRRIAFRPGVANVITGGSKTGKSSLIPIVDYCLGSDKCAIPVATIRDACSWFGVRLRHSGGELLLARREPADQRTTSDAYMVEGPSCEPPPVLAEKNTTVDAVLHRLNALSGLTSLGTDPGSTSGFAGRPSFRDLMAFCFQPQHIVANPHVLYFKADSHEHREKLKAVFPYVLGAVSAETIAKRWELDRLRRKLEILEREAAAQRAVSERWVAELQTWVSKARELGLLRTGEATTDEPDRIRDLLRGVLQRTSRGAQLAARDIAGAVKELQSLRHEEDLVARALAGVRHRLQELARLRDSVDEYSGALRTQRDRLGLARWIEDLVQHRQACPVCDQPMASPARGLKDLLEALQGIEASAGRIESVPEIFEKERALATEECEALVERLTSVRKRISGLETTSGAGASRFVLEETDRFLGRVEHAVQAFDELRSQGGTPAALAELRERVQALSREVSEAQIKQRVQAILERFKVEAARMLPKLDIERPNDPVVLDLAELSLRVVAPGGREDLLWEIGSAANWLGYHPVTTLALQRVFLANKRNPVPGLLIYDQPSQAYFPHLLGGQAREDDLANEDVTAIRKAFQVLGEVALAANGELQIIVLDHAGSAVWGDLPGVYRVEEWRHGNRLVPSAWLA